MLSERLFYYAICNMREIRISLMKAIYAVVHCAGRHFRTKLMSRYIGVGQNDGFDVRIQELVSKAENPGGFLRKKFFRVHFWFFFL